MPSRFTAVTYKEISQLIKQAPVPEIHEDGDEVRFDELLKAYLRWENISEGFVKFCKLISNLILGQIITLNLTNVHKLAA